MNVYMVEWWCDREGKYHQEYYTSIQRLAFRVEMLESDVQNSCPEVSTVFVDNNP